MVQRDAQRRVAPLAVRPQALRATTTTAARSPPRSPPPLVRITYAVQCLVESGAQSQLRCLVGCVPPPRAPVWVGHAIVRCAI